MISDIIIPLLLLITVLYARNKINVYDTFIEGVNEAISMVVSLFPILFAMILGINIFLNCGLIDILGQISYIKEELILILLRPISSGASLGVLNNIYSKYGPDSMIGLTSSVISGSSDTTFYVLSLYFGSVGIKKTKYAFIEGIICDIVGIIVSIIVVKILF